MRVRAKFFVSKVTMFESPEGSGSVSLSARNSKEGDNIDWSKWTPTGNIEMNITNPTAFEFFKEALKNRSAIYVDFEVVTQQ